MPGPPIMPGFRGIPRIGGMPQVPEQPKMTLELYKQALTNTIEQAKKSIEKSTWLLEQLEKNKEIEEYVRKTIED